MGVRSLVGGTSARELVARDMSARAWAGDLTASISLSGEGDLFGRVRGGRSVPTVRESWGDLPASVRE